MVSTRSVSCCGCRRRQTEEEVSVEEDRRLVSVLNGWAPIVLRGVVRRDVHTWNWQTVVVR